MNAMRRAVFDYGRERLTKLAGRIVWHLRRRPATGIFEELGYRTVWDEYCHEVQHGPHDLLENAWSSLLVPFCQAAVSNLGNAEKRLLFFSTDGYFDSDFDEEAEEYAPIDDEALIGKLRSELSAIAVDRNLSRFEE